MNEPIDAKPNDKPYMSLLETLFRIGVMVALLIHSGYMAVAGHRDRGFYLVLFLVFGSFFVLSMAAARNPDTPWVQWLFKARHGPRTDMESMSRTELLQSGTTFIVWSIIAYGALAAVWQLGNFEHDKAPVAAQTAFFVGVLIFLTTFAAALVLLIRGVFKKS